MTVKDIFIVMAIGWVMFPIVSITFSCCVNIFFERKEKHMVWCADKIAERRKKNEHQV